MWQSFAAANAGRAITTGAMRTQAQHLSDDDRRAVAEYLSGRSLSADSHLESHSCGRGIGCVLNLRWYGDDDERDRRLHAYRQSGW